MESIKIDNVDALQTIDYRELEDLQGDLKIINEEDLENLKESIIKYGIFLPKFVWKDGERYWTLDGHQTKKALEQLSGKYVIPKIPVVQIKADNKEEAMQKLLVINSRYGKYNVGTFFIDDLAMPEFIEIPELDVIHHFVTDFDKYDALEEWRGMPEFKSDDLMPYRTIYVHFRNQKDVDKFRQIMKQPIKDKTKYIWFPEEKKGEFKNMSYEDES